MEENRREFKRWNFLPLKILNSEGKHIGNIRDISPKGIGLIVKKDIESSKIFSFKINMPETLDNSENITFKARAVWCKPVWDNRYTAGFEYVNIDKETKIKFKSLIDQYGFDV